MQAARLTWLSAAALDTMKVEASRTFPLETGGVLLGYWSGNEAVIIASSGPGPLALHGEDHYVPDNSYHSSFVAAAYAASGRRATYLGDWHSHPLGSCSLSELDIKTMRRIARHQRARVSCPLMLVLSGREPWQVHIWYGLPPSQAAVHVFGSP